MNDYERIADLIEQGQKIEAIKLLREATGVSLAEAKAQIEQLTAEAAGQAVPDAPQAPLDSTSGLPEDVLALAHAGQKIEAIKLLRERTGLGLKEAKERVEAETGPISSTRPALLAIAIAVALMIFGIVAALLAMGA